jgi:predicted ATPase
VLSHLRLTAFKSFLGQALELRPLTLLVGPNASGKSNVIDSPFPAGAAGG